MTTTFASSIPPLTSGFENWKTPLNFAEDYANGMVLPIQDRKDLAGLTAAVGLMASVQKKNCVGD